MNKFLSNKRPYIIFNQFQRVGGGGVYSSSSFEKLDEIPMRKKTKIEDTLAVLVGWGGGGGLAPKHFWLFWAVDLVPLYYIFSI
jgi:hypothetical protein